MYDFDSITDRRGTDSIKWDVDENELPMWVADMDFPTAPEIVNAFSERLNHSVFGYGKLKTEWFNAYINWWKSRHDFEMKKEGLIFCSGVVPGITSIIRHLTAPGDVIIMFSPTYNHFYNCIQDNGRRILDVDLNFSGHDYSIDFKKLEDALGKSDAKLMIICNPQNPTGTVWNRNDFERIGELCAKYSVTIVSDEIHCDIITPGTKYTPFAAVSETCSNNSIICIAPTKAFNLAGLQTSAIYVENKILRKRVSCAIEKDELSMPNSFAASAAIAAFNYGKVWLNELNEYIYKNKMIVNDYLHREIPKIRLIWGDATYLLWLDCTSLNIDSKSLAQKIRKETGLFLMAGSYYGNGGNGFLRMNIACPQTMLLDGLDRLRRGIESINTIE